MRPRPGYFYLLTPDYPQLVSNCGGRYDDAKLRPVYCVREDKHVKGLYWFVPASSWDHKTPAKQQKIIDCLNAPKNEMRNAWYAVGYTTRKSVFDVSTALPVTEKYVARPYRDDNEILKIHDNALEVEISSKLNRILGRETVRPNMTPQHITDVVSHLEQELQIAHEQIRAARRAKALESRPKRVQDHLRAAEAAKEQENGPSGKERPTKGSDEPIR